MTYRELYDLAVKSLQNADIAEAGLDARLILEAVFEGNRNLLLLDGEKEAPSEKILGFRELVEQRAMHIPLQQLLGVQNFMGLDFKVNDKVLIPRQDTETLVEEVLIELHDGMSVLDMCTGSGAILISLLNYKNDCIGVGSDLSAEALSVARENASRLLPEEKQKNISFLQGDLFEPVEGKFDRIVSNPPYIPTEVIPTLMPEVRDHEPLMALDGDRDGLRFYRQIIAQSKDYLYHGGMLYFEIGYDQKEAVIGLMKEAGFVQITCVKDLAGLDRVVYGTYL